MAATTTTSTGARTTADTATVDVTATGTAVYVDPPVLPRPIVYEAKRKRRRKRYSRGLKDPQKLERGLTRAFERLADGIADGTRKYRRKRNRSARRKRDGAIKDLARNVGRGAEEFLRTSAKAPTDLTRYATRKRLTRLVSITPLFPFAR